MADCDFNTNTTDHPAPKAPISLPAHNLMDAASGLTALLRSGAVTDDNREAQAREQAGATLITSPDPHVQRLGYLLLLDALLRSGPAVLAEIRTLRDQLEVIKLEGTAADRAEAERPTPPAPLYTQADLDAAHEAGVRAGMEIETQLFTRACAQCNTTDPPLRSHDGGATWCCAEHDDITRHTAQLDAAAAARPTHPRYPPLPFDLIAAPDVEPSILAALPTLHWHDGDLAVTLDNDGESPPEEWAWIRVLRVRESGGLAILTLRNGQTLLMRADAIPPTPTTDAYRHATGGTALYGDGAADVDPLPFDDVEAADVDDTPTPSPDPLRAALRRDVQVRNLVLTWELHGAQLPQPYQRRGTLIAAIHRLLEEVGAAVEVQDAA